ncbi:MAG: SRPBCC family protein [Bacteroidota bacterium]
MMKYSGSLEINQPLEVIAAFFADSRNLHKWQDGFVSKELLSGVEGTPGAVSKMYYKFGGKEMVMKETIASNQLPHAFEAFYEHQHMDNTMKCSFTALSEDKTRYDYQYEYTRMSWVMPRLMAILFPGIYRKQGEKWMQQFKEAVEKQ